MKNYKEVNLTKVAVASRSFSKNEVLKNEIKKIYTNVKFNEDGNSLFGDSLIEFLKNADKAIIGLEKIDDSILSNLPNLKVISKYGVGIDTINLKSLRNFNVKLGWKSGVNKRSVSELVVSSAIALLHKTVFGNSEVKNGKWYQIIGRQLTGIKFGIIGCGNIGKDLVRLLAPFRCKIYSYDIRHSNTFNKKYKIKKVSLNFLLKNSDIISIHLPLNLSTQNILGQKELNIIKRSYQWLNDNDQYSRAPLSHSLDKTFIKLLNFNKKYKRQYLSDISFNFADRGKINNFN